MSCVASRPAVFRATVASVTGFGRAKKFCQGELTEAKPDRRAMTDIPMTPIFSDVSSTMFGRGSVGPTSGCLPSRYSPLDQNPNSQAAKHSICNNQAHLAFAELAPEN